MQPNTIQTIQTSDQTPGGAYRYMIAWLLIFVVLVLLNKTKMGHTVIYYTLVLAILLLLLTQYQAIASILAPLQPGGKAPSSSGGAAAGAGGTAGSF